jgi:hypothetical protein
MAQQQIQLRQIDFGGRGPDYDVVVKTLSEHDFKWSTGGQTWNRSDGSTISDVALSDLCAGWPVFARELMAAVVRGVSPIEFFVTVENDKNNNETRAVFRLQKTALDKLAEV